MLRMPRPTEADFLHDRHLTDRIRRVLSPSYGARANAAQALDDITARGDDVVLHGSDLALLSGHPAGLSRRRVAGRLGTALWEAFTGQVALLAHTGAVRSVTGPWRQFPLQQGGGPAAGFGMNYL